MCSLNKSMICDLIWIGWFYALKGYKVNSKKNRHQFFGNQNNWYW